MGPALLERPLLWSAVFFMAGIFPGPAGRGLLPAACLCAVCLTGSCALRLAASHCLTRRFAAALLLGGFFLAGRIAAMGIAVSPPEGLESLLEQHPALMSEGVGFAATVRQARRERQGRIGLLVDLSRIDLSGLRMPVTGRVVLRVEEGTAAAWPLPSRGDHLEGFARIREPLEFGNPGAFAYGRHLRSRGIAATGWVKSTRLLASSPPRDGSWWLDLRRLLDGTRDRLLEGIDASFDGTPPGRRAAAVTAAILLGDRERLDRSEVRLLQEAGLAHLLAVSGFHVAVLGGFVLLALRSAGAGPRVAALAAIPVLLLYLGLNEPRDSVTRAVVMAVCLLSGRLIHRRPDALNSVGTACLIILAASPLQIHDAGFQLTFAATASLIGIAPKLAMAFPRWLPRLDNRAGRWGATAMSITLSAMAGTLPLVAYHFNRITPGAILSNTAGGALVALAFLLAIPLTVAAQTIPWLASGLGVPIGWIVTGLHGVASTVVDLPGMTYRRVTPSPALCAVYYAALILLLAAARRGWHRAWRRVTTIAWVLSVVTLVLPVDTRRPPGGMRITMLDVGQGESILLESAGGGRVLIDAGATLRGGFDLGESVVSRTLWALGIGSLDLLVVTHGDNDHAGGAAAVAGNFRPREIWLPPPGEDSGEALGALLEQIGPDRATVTRAVAGHSIDLGGMRLEVLNPPAGPGGSRQVDSNESSLVAMASWGRRRALFTADAGTIAERGLDRLPRMDVLKVGHHGSRTATSRLLLSRVRPRLGLISCGRSNRFGHPHPEVLRRLEEIGARICRTDRHGAVQIDLLDAATVLGAPCPGGASGLQDRERLRDEAQDEDDQRE